MPGWRILFAAFFGSLLAVAPVQRVAEERAAAAPEDADTEKQDESQDETPEVTYFRAFWYRPLATTDAGPRLPEFDGDADTNTDEDDASVDRSVAPSTRILRAFPGRRHGAPAPARPDASAGRLDLPPPARNV